MLHVFLSTYLVFNFHTALQPPTVQPPGKQDPINVSWYSVSCVVFVS